MVLIKKKDVPSYFAARRNRHPLRAQSASVADATGFSAAEPRAATAGKGKAILTLEAAAPEGVAPETPVPAFMIGPRASTASAPHTKKSPYA